jgi:predicted nucleic acid-binding protein
MYLLDTNVISEMRKAANGRADRAVQHWSDRVDRERVYLSTITILEMEIGVLRMQRKDAVQARHYEVWLHEQVLRQFAGHIVAVDSTIALRCAALHVPVTVAYNDSLIAATALVHGLTVVTRNVKDFVPMGVKVLNPWEG